MKALKRVWNKVKHAVARDPDPERSHTTTIKGLRVVVRFYPKMVLYRGGAPVGRGAWMATIYRRGVGTRGGSLPGGTGRSYEEAVRETRKLLQVREGNDPSDWKKRPRSHVYASPEVKRSASYKRAERLENQLAPQGWTTPGLSRSNMERIADAWDRAGFYEWADNYRAHFRRRERGAR